MGKSLNMILAIFVLNYCMSCSNHYSDKCYEVVHLISLRCHLSYDSHFSDKVM